MPEHSYNCVLYQTHWRKELKNSHCRKKKLHESNTQCVCLNQKCKRRAHNNKLLLNCTRMEYISVIILSNELKMGLKKTTNQHTNKKTTNHLLQILKIRVSLPRGKKKNHNSFHRCRRNETDGNSYRIVYSC